jgi:DNA-binding response OmpR family regulator
VSDHPTQSPAASHEPTMTVLVYSDDITVRAAVRSALGRRPAAGLPLLQYVECATEPAVIARMDAGGVQLAILDGEATPAGGMGICRQLKDEIYRCPPVLVLIGRPQDAWLATWSRADAVVSHPLDPILLAQTAAGLLVTRSPLAPSATPA